MSEKQNFISGIREFFADVGAEMHKITWPERDELLDSTVVVIVSVLLFGLFLALSDKLLITILRLLVHH